MPPRNNRPHLLPARTVTSKSQGPRPRNSPPRPPTRNTPPHPLPVRIAMVGFPDLSPWRNPPHPPPIQIAMAEPPKPPPIINPPHPLPVRNWVFPDEVWKTIKNSPYQESYDLPLIFTNDHAPVSVKLEMDLGIDNTKTDIDAFKVSAPNTPQERDALQERNTDVLQDVPSEEDREKQPRTISDKRLASRPEKRAARPVAADFYDIDEDEPIDFHDYYRASLGLPLHPVKDEGVQMGGNEDKLPTLRDRFKTMDETSNRSDDDGRLLRLPPPADLGRCIYKTFGAPPKPSRISISAREQLVVATDTTGHPLGDTHPTDEGVHGSENKKKRKKKRRQKDRKRRKLNDDAEDDIILCADEKRLIAEENQQKELARRAAQREREKKKHAERIAKEMTENAEKEQEQNAARSHDVAADAAKTDSYTCRCCRRAFPSNSKLHVHPRTCRVGHYETQFMNGQHGWW